MAAVRLLLVTLALVPACGPLAVQEFSEGIRGCVRGHPHFRARVLVS